MRCGCLIKCAACWQAFGQRHFWAAELGPLVCIGLSTVRFRSNTFRHTPSLPSSWGILAVVVLPFDASVMLLGKGRAQLSLSVSRALFLLYHGHAVLHTEKYLPSDLGT